MINLIKFAYNLHTHKKVKSEHIKRCIHELDARLFVILLSSYQQQKKI
jgi:hypothetical protein